jgi:hypothetical protein
VKRYDVVSVRSKTDFLSVETKRQAKERETDGQSRNDATSKENGIGTE